MVDRSIVPTLCRFSSLLFLWYVAPRPLHTVYEIAIRSVYHMPPTPTSIPSPLILPSPISPYPHVKAREIFFPPFLLFFFPPFLLASLHRSLARSPLPSLNDTHTHPPISPISPNQTSRTSNQPHPYPSPSPSPSPTQPGSSFPYPPSI